MQELKQPLHNDHDEERVPTSLPDNEEEYLDPLAQPPPPWLIALVVAFFVGLFVIGGVWLQSVLNRFG